MGANVGIEVGIGAGELLLVGAGVGCGLENGVGCGVGRRVGILVGGLVGGRVGGPVGGGFGLLVGNGVGLGDGILVGGLVGGLVGLFVGAGWTRLNWIRNRASPKPLSIPKIMILNLFPLALLKLLMEKVCPLDKTTTRFESFPSNQGFS